MKIRALMSAAALVSTSLSMISTPAYAVATGTPVAPSANSVTLAAMATQCTNLAAAHSTGNGDIWSGVVVPGNASLDTGSVTETGTRAIDQQSITPTGTYVPSRQEIRGDPFRTGGSVNLFGDQWSTAGYYPGSTYNYTASFDMTFSFAFSCDIKNAVYHAAYDDPAVPVQGFYEVSPLAPGNSESNRMNCDAFTALGSQDPRPDWWGTDHAFCNFKKTADAIPPAHHPAYNSAPELVTNEAGTAVPQGDTQTLAGYEANGPQVQVTGEHHDGQVVVCISPGSKGGAWRAQNGYSGGDLKGPASGCNTPYFKVAPYGNGSQTSNGTFTSVPSYSLLLN